MPETGNALSPTSLILLLANFKVKKKSLCIHLESIYCCCVRLIRGDTPHASPGHASRSSKSPRNPPGKGRGGNRPLEQP